MPISCNQAVRLFKDAFAQFLAREAEHILTGISERNLCGRLAPDLEQAASRKGLAGYIADPEYNRMQRGQVKTILDSNYEVVTVCCDLILHTRGKSIPHDNLIAIEMKKSDRPAGKKESDRKRLRAMTKASYDDVWSADGETHPEHVCGYILGVYLELNLQAAKFDVEFYSAGEQFLIESVRVAPELRA
jgi:hypothetical protein